MPQAASLPETDASIKNYGATEPLAEPSKVKEAQGIPRACWFILGVELCERLAFYTLNGTQEFFLERIGVPMSDAAALNATMWTLCTVWALLASWIADSVLGRYSTIVTSGIMYVCAMAMASVAALPGRENASLYFTGTLIFLPLATAGIKANISNFGAAQYDSTPEGKAGQESFFSVFYMMINIGAGLAYGFMTTFAASGGLGVSRENGYAVAYGMMAVAMTIAVGVFCTASGGYRSQPMQRSSSMARVVRCLFRCARSGCRSAQAVCSGVALLIASIALSVFGAVVGGDVKSMTSSVFFCTAIGTLSVVLPCRNPGWLRIPEPASIDEDSAVDSADEVRQEESEIRTFLRLMPALFTGTLAFSAPYNSMQFWYQQQACQMNLQVNEPRMGVNLMLSGSFFNLADCVAIIVMTPIVIGFFDPWMARMSGRQPGSGSKFAVGMVIAGASVIFAARLEGARRGAGILDSPSTCAPKGVFMSDIMAAWMTVPYFLMGLAEIYCNVTLMYYAYAKCPDSMRNLSSACYFFAQAVSSGIFAVMVQALATFIPDNLNEGHLEYGYYANLLAGFAFYIFFRSVVE